MTVRQRPLDREAVGGDHKRLAAQHPPQRLDLRLRPIRQIGERPGLHFAVLAPALTQEYGGRRGPVRHARDVHEPHRSCYSRHVKQETPCYMPTYRPAKSPFLQSLQILQPETSAEVPARTL